MAGNLKQRLCEILGEADDQDLRSRISDSFLLVMILVNATVVILETVPTVRQSHAGLLKQLDLFALIIFTIEYLLRLWVCTCSPKYHGPGGRIKYALSPMGLVDLLAVLPFYLPLFFGFSPGVLRLFSVLRLIRLLKVMRYSRSFKVFKDVYALKRSELIMCFLAILFLLVIASSILYFVEREAQPEAFSSIPAAMWWGTAALTTVGYGDTYPITPMGKFLGSIIALLGIGLFALPAGIVSSGFVLVLRRKGTSHFYCPHCGEEITRSS